MNYAVNPKNFGLGFLDLKDETYLEFVRCLECFVCGNSGRSDPHHVEHGRRNDYTAVPLCRVCHQEYHRIEHKAFEAIHNIDLSYVVRNLLAHYLTERK